MRKKKSRDKADGEERWVRKLDKWKRERGEGGKSEAEDTAKIMCGT